MGNPKEQIDKAVEIIRKDLDENSRKPESVWPFELLNYLTFEGVLWKLLPTELFLPSRSVLARVSIPLSIGMSSMICTQSGTERIEGVRVSGIERE